MRYLRSRSQAALEYLMLVGGVLLFIVFITVLVRGGLLPRTQNKISEDVKSYFDKHARYYLFFENFDSGTSSRWENDSIGWSVQNGKYVAMNPGKSIVDLTLSNFSYTAFVNTSPAAGSAAGLVFRYRNASNYYKLIASTPTQNVRLYRITNGVETILSSGGGIDSKQGVYLRIDANGSDMAFYANNARLNTLSDSAELQGRFGFIVSSGTATFDDVGIFSCVGQCGEAT